MIRRVLSIALLVALASPARADEVARVLTGGARQEAAAAGFGGLESAGVVVWLDAPDVNRTVFLSYVYRWQGFVSGTERYRNLVRRPHAGLFFRSTATMDVLTRGGTALGLGQSFGLGGRVGTADGSFSVVLSPMVGVEGFWVVREGSSGLGARIPIAAELGLEGRVGRWVPYLAARPILDVWPGRLPAYRAEVTAGLGLVFDWPRGRKPGEPAPPGP